MTIGFEAPEDTTSSGAAPSVVSGDGEAARSSAASSFVVVGRLLLLLVAAAALVSGIVLARAHDRAISGSVARYVCPMHPEVVSSTPGDCPICGMALDPVTESAGIAAMTDDTDGAAHAERRIFAEQVRAAAWLGADGVGTAVLYSDDLVGLNPDEHALFFGGAAPSMGIDVRLLADPPSPVDSSTVTVRFRLDPAGAPASFRGPRDVGSLQIALRPRELLVVPSSAVLYSAQGAYVLAASEHDETFTKRSVRIGRILDSGYVGGRAGEVGSIVILSGLNEGDAVIAAHTFFVDAERRLQAARGTGGGMGHGTGAGTGTGRGTRETVMP
jgi:Heavy metal binding domain